MILAEDHTWTHKPPVLLFFFFFFLHDFLVVLNRKQSADLIQGLNF